MNSETKSTEKERHPGGRPTLYDPKYCDEIIEYFDIEPNREVERITTRKDGSETKENILVPNDLPTLAGFACKIGVCRETLWHWQEQHPEFFNAIKKVKEHQERILLSNGLNNLYQPAFAIFTAKNLIGWNDKQQVEHTGKDGGAIQTEDVSDKEFARRMAFLLEKGARDAKQEG